LRDGFANFNGVFPSAVSCIRAADSGLRRMISAAADDDQGEIVVHLMAQVGELFVQPGDLLGGQCDGFGWQAIGGIIAPIRPEINWFRAERF